MLEITTAFSSLSVDESSSNNTNQFNLNKNCTSGSLPNISSINENQVKAPKFTQFVYEDDQPIDFSKKYSDNNTKKTPKQPNSAYNKVVKNYNKTFSIYAETDLDQPTNYSLRYAEDSDSDSDSHERNKASGFQDTVKTYCTEDTPYETPFNFSTATSMSDLRIDVKVQEEKKKDIKEILEESPNKAQGKSDEKPVNYCDEGTPGFLSRVGSFNSLNSAKMKKSCIEKGKLKGQTEIKAVKFEDVVNYAEETPLMFSRSSSLASLDSIEQHSIQDDRSSLVSDFSRLTSGLVSPSELPDSPSQTVPTSPKPGKIPVFKLKKTVTDDTKNTVFEDNLTKFKMESTPIQFSSTTSLSSLTIDDLDEAEAKKPTKNTKDGSTSNVEGAVIVPNLDSTKTYCTEDTPAILSHAGSNSDLSADKLLSDIESDISDDDDLLAECIQSAMPKTTKAAEGASSSRKSSQSSSINYDDDDDKDLLKECILSGMLKTQNQGKVDDSDNDEYDEILLKKCIQEGMLKQMTRDFSDNQYERNVAIERNVAKKLQQANCLTSDLTDAERVLLQQCIISGMRKNSKSLPTKSKPKTNSTQNHRCCIHCPINQNKAAAVATSHAKLKKKNKVQIKQERTDVCLTYVRNELVYKPHEEWI